MDALQRHCPEFTAIAAASAITRTEGEAERGQEQPLALQTLQASVADTFLGNKANAQSSCLERTDSSPRAFPLLLQEQEMPERLGRYQPVQGTSHQLSPALQAVVLQNAGGRWHPAGMRYMWHRTWQLSQFNTFHLPAMLPLLQ